MGTFRNRLYVEVLEDRLAPATIPVGEAEPNDSLATAQLLPPPLPDSGDTGYRIAGTVLNRFGDADFYAFFAEAGDPISVNVINAPNLPDAYPDRFPSVTLFAPDGSVAARGSPIPSSGQFRDAPRLTHTITQTGIWTALVAVNGSTWPTTDPLTGGTYVKRYVATISAPVEVQNYQEDKTDAIKVATLISENRVLNPAGLPYDSKFNKRDNDRFYIVLNDRAIASSQIRLESIARDGTTILDSLPALRVTPHVDPVTLLPTGRFASDALILVADPQDDGFGGNEGADNDVTIQAEAGGTFKVIYVDSAGNTIEEEVNVTRPEDLRKIVLNITYLNGLGYTTAGITDATNLASRMFSQANAYLEIKSVRGVNDPGGLADLDEFTGATLTPEERQLLAINRDNTAGVINVYFVDTLVGSGSLGEAVRAAVFTNPMDAPLTGSIVVTKAAHYRTYAHELTHILLDSSHNTSDRRRMLHGLPGQDPLTQPLEKRLLRTEVSTIAGSPYSQKKSAAPQSAAPTSSRSAAQASATAYWMDAATPTFAEVVTPTQSAPVRPRPSAVSGAMLPVERKRVAGVAVDPVPTRDAGIYFASDGWGDFALFWADLSPWEAETDR